MLGITDAGRKAAVCGATRTTYRPAKKISAVTCPACLRRALAYAEEAGGRTIDRERLREVRQRLEVLEAG